MNIFTKKRLPFTGQMPTSRARVSNEIDGTRNRRSQASLHLHARSLSKLLWRFYLAASTDRTSADEMSKEAHALSPLRVRHEREEAGRFL